MAKRNVQQDAEEKVEKVLSTTESFLVAYKNYLIYGVAIVLAVVLIYFGYNQLYLSPMQEEARGQMFTAEQYFRSDSLSLALNGDGNNLGFRQIIDAYGDKAGKAVYLYAGICQLHVGEYENAIENLKKYDVGDEITTARALCCIGDAYVQLNNYREAINYFLKAANYRNNDYTAGYLLKAGLVYEEMGEKEEALKLYQRIKENYAQTVEGREVDKYIGRINPTL